MNTPRTIEGKWWIFGKEQPAHFGTLTFDPEEKLELVTKTAHDHGSVAVVMATFGDRTSEREIVHGIDEHGSPVTLFGCIWSRSVSMGMECCTIRSLAALLNFKADSWSEPKF